MTIESATLFAAYLGAEGLSVSTIESYLAALRHIRVLADPGCLAPSLHSPHMKILLRGIRRVHAQQCSSPRIRLPITASIMRRIKTQLAGDPSAYVNRLIWAACCTGFFGFLRCGEFLVPDGTPFHPSFHLCLSDLTLDQSSPQWRITLNIKVSKTDQFRRGTTIVLGATAADLCPVSALLDYLVARGGAPGPLFITGDSQALTRSVFVQQVQAALSASGLDGSKFNGHSFRIGAATSASQGGVPETTIKILGRWQSTAYQQYIRPSADHLANVSGQLC